MQKNILKNFQSIYEKVKKAKVTPVILVIFPHYIEIIKTIKKAIDENICKFILIGNKQLIEKLLIEQEISFSPILNILNINEESNACIEGVKAIKNGLADILMKGDIKTSTILKAVLDKENGLRTGKILSHIYVAEVRSYHKMILMSDGGLAIRPDLETKIGIIKNAVEFAKKIGIETPKVALLSAVEVVNPDMEETVDAERIVKMQKQGEIIVDAIIEGPLALDIALSKKAAMIKKIDSNIAEDTDIFIVPNISSGNIFGKALIYFANAKAGGIVWGAKVPIVLLSRADDWETKFRSILLGIVSTL